VIVDPAEAMRDEAANALLKTLEEPPAGTGFILVATHASALLPTIRSRCQRVRFSAVPDEELTSWLQARGLPDAAAIARSAQGCPGRALAQADGGLVARREVRDGLLTAMGGSLKELFDWTAGVAKGERSEWRAQVVLVLDLVDELLRDAVVKASGARGGLLHGDRETLVAAWAAALWPDGITRCAEAVAEAREQLELNVGGKNLLDAALAKVATELGRARAAS
jgi:DNA polymerase-3 subunit delta'